jgi:hypothetical protein
MIKQLTTIPEEIFTKFCEYYNIRDMDKMLSLFTKNATLWGTGIDEYRFGIDEIEAQFKRDWSQSQSGKLEISKHIHSSKDGKSWGSCICLAKIEIDGVIHEFPNLRGSVFLEEEGGKMKIAHLHSSFPDPIQESGNSFRS